MGSYSLEINAAAKRELEAVGDQRDRARIFGRIAGLGDDPRPHGSEKLAGSTNHYRIRQGDYRILYEIREAVKVVAVLHVGHRREVYRASR